MANARRVVLVSALICGLFRKVIGQTVSPPPVDSRETYVAALRFVVAAHESSLRASDPKQASVVRYAIQKELQIGEADYVPLVREAANLRTAIDPSNGKSLNRAGREGAIYQTLVRLRAGMSPAGWTGFRTFVNGPFRQATIAVPAR